MSIEARIAENSAALSALAEAIKALTDVIVDRQVVTRGSTFETSVDVALPRAEQKR